MRFLKIIPACLVIVAFMIGCSKDKDKVSELEQEVMQEQGENYMAEPAPTVDTPAQPEPVVQEYAKTPEVAPAEEPKRESKRPGGSGYTVQIAAGTNYNYVRYMADKFVTRGYEAFITEATVQGVNFYRIRIGSYGTVTEARRAGDDLRDKYSVQYWIDNNI